MALPWRRMVRFGLVGGAVTGFNYLIYVAFIRAGFHYLIGATIGWMVGVAISFLGNRYWTFRPGGAPRLHEVGKFIGTYLLQLLVGSATLVILIDGFHIGDRVAYVMNLPVTALLSYVVLDRLVFIRRAAPTT
jgi:putative flippase GtrA